MNHPQTDPFVDHLHVDKETEHGALSAEDLATEALRGAGVARALVEHVGRMNVAGYANEFFVEGETWVVEAWRKTPAS